MEEEVQVGKLYVLNNKNENLHFIKEINFSCDLYLIEELDIEPFDTFSVDFSSEYWYLKYHLLRDKKVLLNIEDSILFDEENINVIFFKATDLKSFVIECNDGNWYFRINKLDINALKIFDILKINIIR
ncbi:hypothetical protein AB4865_06970 [Capnocytophaga sp. ARDL2]|uniref:hypothetical protein n=1 Tax=Capnocytophaga sp. ARDL2 TaxID=3238809 RepID=UPI00355644DE